VVILKKKDIKNKGYGVCVCVCSTTRKALETNAQNYFGFFEWAIFFVLLDPNSRSRDQKIAPAAHYASGEAPPAGPPPAEETQNDWNLKTSKKSRLRRCLNGVVRSYAR
jgi:hypothetical protein